MKVSIISIAFLSIDRCTHRNFHIDRTITKHRLIDVMYRSIDTKGPSIDTKGPSIDTKGPSIDTKGPSIDAKCPSIDRYEGSIMERRLGQNSSFLFDSKPQSMENNHCNNDVDHLRSIAFSLRSNAIVVTSTSTKID